MTLQKKGNLVFPIAVLEAQDSPLEVQWVPPVPEEWANTPLPRPFPVTIVTQKMDTGYLIEIETQGRAALICAIGAAPILSMPWTGRSRAFSPSVTAWIEERMWKSMSSRPRPARSISRRTRWIPCCWSCLPSGCAAKLAADSVPVCGANLNQGDCGCRPDETDPRWEALKGALL